MTAASQLESLDLLLDPVRDCLTVEVASRIAALRASADVQLRLDMLAERNAEGTITPDERDEDESLVSAGNLIAVLQAKARSKLARGCPPRDAATRTLVRSPSRGSVRIRRLPAG